MGVKPRTFAMESDNYTPQSGHTVFEELQPGLEIGPEDSRFLLVHLIGKGGMGHIWLARDLKEESVEGGERFKAIKVVHPDLRDHPRALDSLKLEAVRAAKLNHPNIVNVQDWHQGKDGWIFVAMEYLQGRNLDRLLHEEGGKVSWERALELLRPIVAALEYAHSQRIIHRDLKPGNVFITDQNEVKLLDFGLAYRLYRSSSHVSKISADTSGTAEYMPPEAHLGGEPDSQTQDVYALACVIYELLVGEPPYSHQAALARPAELYPNPPDVLKPAAWEVLKTGMAYKKEDRPQSAGELLEQLEAAQAGRKIGGKKLLKQNYGRVVIAVIVISIAGGGYWAYGSWSSWQQKKRELEDERLWQATPQTLTGYQDYLRQCVPICAHQAQAQQAIQQLEQQAEEAAARERERQQDDAAFAVAKQADTVQAYGDYLKRCPACQHQIEAESALKELQQSNLISSGKEQEPNGHVSQANWIEIGKTYQGTLDRERDDADYFAFTTSGVETPYVRVLVRILDHGGTGPNFGIYAKLQDFDTEKKLGEELATYGDNLSHAFKVLPDKKYFLKLYLLLPWSSHCTYELRLTPEARQ